MKIHSLTLFCVVLNLLSVANPAIAQKLELVVQSGHSATVLELAFSPDGKILASADARGIIKLWDLATYKEIRTIDTGVRETTVSPFPNALAFSSDGKHLFVLAQDRSAQIFETASGLKVVQIGKSGQLLNLFGATLHSGKMLAAQLTERGEIQVVNLKTGKEIFVLRLAPANSFERPDFHDLAFSPNGGLLAGSAWGGRVALFNTVTGKLVRAIKTDETDSLAFSADGKTIATCEKDRDFVASYIKLRQIETGNITKSIKIAFGEITFLAFSPDARKLAAILKKKNEKESTEEYSVKLWDLTTFKELHELTGDYVSSFWAFNELSFSPDGRRLAIAAGDVTEGRVYMYDVERGIEIAQLKRHSSSVYAIRYLENGQFIAESPGLRIWDMTSGRQVENRILAEHSTSPDGGKRIAYNTLIRAFEITDLASGRKLGELKSKAFNITNYAVTFSPKGRYILAYSSRYFLPRPGDQIMLFDAMTGDLLVTFPDGGKQVAFSPDDKWLAYGMTVDAKSRKCAVKLWDIERRIELKAIDYPNSELLDPIRALAFNPTGDRLAIATHTNGENFTSKYSLDLYSVPKGELLHAFGEQRVVDALAFSPDGAVLASSYSEKIKLWDVSNGKEIGDLAAHDSLVNSLSFSFDGKILASGSSDGQVIFWNYKKREITSRLVIVGESDYIFITPENYYFASRKGAAAAIAFRYGTKAFPFEQFDIRFNRPDLVLKTLGTSTDRRIEIYEKAHQSRLDKYNLTEADINVAPNLPEVSIVTQNIPGVTKQKRLKFQIKASDASYALSRLNVYVNDAPIYGSKGLYVGDAKDRELYREINIELSPGNNRVQVSAVNEKQIESVRQTFGVRFEGRGPLPELYILAIGVTEYADRNLKLNYPALDAASIVDIFENRASQKEKILTLDPAGSREEEAAKSFYKVKTMRLTDENATVEKIVSARRFLEQAKTDDQIVVFISGHGFLDKGNYFFATHDIEVKNPAARGLSYEALENLLDGLSARRKLLLIDTCHAGEIGKSEAEKLVIKDPINSDGGVIKSLDMAPKSGVIKPVKNGFQNSADLAEELFADLRLGSGIWVVSASGGLEYAYESTQWSGGVFTYAVRLGLKEMQADANNDGAITALELRHFVQGKVPELTKGRQRPTFRHESVEFDCRIY